MSTNNFDAAAHKNFMGGTSYSLSPLTSLRVMACSCFFSEPAYYLDSSSTATLMENAIDAALDFDLLATLRFAVELRHEWHIRLTPIVIAVRASHVDKIPEDVPSGAIRHLISSIMGRADDILNALSYNEKAFSRRRIKGRLIKGLRDYANTLSDYQIAKYKSGKEGGYNMYDAMNMLHPKGAAWDNLHQKKLLLGTEEAGNTWESYISRNGASNQTWTAALDLMGHMALLRNLRNLSLHKVPVELYADKLLSGVAGGKQLPFRYLSAYNSVVETPDKVRLQSLLETCIDSSIAHLPFFAGRTMSLVDNSGSAQGCPISTMSTMSVAGIGNLMGVLTARRSDEGFVGVFGDRLQIIKVEKNSPKSSLSLTNECTKIGSKIGGGTENGIWLFFEEALREKQWWDNIFIYSDMQAGRGELYGRNSRAYSKYSVNSKYIDVCKLVQTYAETVNPEVKVFSVQIAGYPDNILPEYQPNMFILGGWSENILRYAEQVSKEVSQ